MYARDACDAMFSFSFSKPHMSAMSAALDIIFSAVKLAKLSTDIEHDGMASFEFL